MTQMVSGRLRFLNSSKRTYLIRETANPDWAPGRAGVGGHALFTGSESSLPLSLLCLLPLFFPLGFVFWGFWLVGWVFLWGSFAFLILHPKQLFHFLLEIWALNKCKPTCTYRYRGCTVVIRCQCTSTGNTGCQRCVQLMNKHRRSGNYQLEFASIMQNTCPVFAEINSVHQGRAELQCSSGQSRRLQSQPLTLISPCWLAHACLLDQCFDPGWHRLQSRCHFPHSQDK